ncbi:MAG: hypothetical protein KDB07_05680 [Planctomycetes bacterium]|nr:hypothetical protein [Planctomycetota bacterium]
MSISDYPVGAGGDLRFSSLRGRSPDSRARAGIRYPSPFFDIGHTYLPPNLKSLLRWCRYYYYTNPTINAAVTKMAAYPLTELLYDTESTGHQHVWDNLLSRRLKLRSFLYGVGLDYFTYGNAFIGISFPMRKHLICKSCGASHDIQRTDYKFRDFKYEGVCQTCHHQGEFTVHDRYYRSADDIRLMRWNPEDIDIEYQSHNGTKKILYNIPVQLRNDIRLGKRSVIESVPDIYVQAVKQNKALHLTKCYHFARESISQNSKNMGWGISMILPVMKETYYMQMLRKAQEMIAQEHIVPLRILFPQGGSATSDPYSTINLQEWSAKMRKEVEAWKYDSNHIPIMPIPVGNETLGGDGRALLLSQEMRLIEESIIAGMGVPIEFVKGGTSYGGTSLSMHILKNQFETYRAFVLELIQDFIITEIAKYMEWPTIKIRLKRFHMADDLQRASLSFQLNAAAKLSDKTMLEELNYDSEEEAQIIKREGAQQLRNMSDQQLAQAHMQGEAGKIQQRYQMTAQQEMSDVPPPSLGQPPQGPPPAPEAAGLRPPVIDNARVAKQLARKFSQMPDDQVYANLRTLQPYPELHAAVLQELNSMRGRPNSAAQPLPEQLPPRRGPAQSPM